MLPPPWLPFQVNDSNVGKLADGMSIATMNNGLLLDYYWIIVGSWLFGLSFDWIIIRLYWFHDDFQGFFYKDLARQTLQQIKGLSSDFHHNVLSLGSGRKGEEGKPWLMLIYIYSFIIIFIISIVYNYIVIWSSLVLYSVIHSVIQNYIVLVELSSRSFVDICWLLSRLFLKLPPCPGAWESSRSKHGRSRSFDSVGGASRHHLNIPSQAAPMTETSPSASDQIAF